MEYSYLNLCNKLFSILNNNQVNYCHWKSNCHLDKALNGKTDVDILVSEEDKEQFESILKEFGFLKIQTPAIKSTYKVCDFLGFDNDTTNMTHFHVHYVVVLGEKYVKNYFLPIEESFLTNNSVKFNVRIPNPNLELLILIIRMHIKLDWFDFVTYPRHKSIFPSRIIEEYKSLSENFVEDEFTTYANSIFPGNYLNHLLTIKSNILKGKYSILDAYRNKFLFKKLLRNFKKERGLSFIFKKFYLSIRYFKYTQKIKRVRKKTLTNKSISIAFVGADGSGKSTITKDIAKWLSWKLEVEKLYLGIPKKSSILKLWILLRKIFSRLASILGQGARMNSDKIFMIFQWLFIAHKRKNIGQKIIKSKDKGHIIIIDRFPLDCFDIMKEPMDRPRIKKILNKENWLSRYEEQYYQNIPKPDKIFILKADIDTLRSRKTDIELNKHIDKVDAINSIKGEKDVILIDANMPYIDVQRVVKLKIWDILNESY